MTNDTVHSIKENASRLYKNKEYEKAFDLYSKLYAEYKQDFNEWDARFYAWCIYYLKIRSKKNEDIAENENLFFKEVNIILTLVPSNNEFVYITTVFKVLDYLKSKNIFPAKEILNWTAKIDPSVLETDCFSFQDREGKTREKASRKEEYYSLRTKALEKDKHYEDCIKLSEEALSALEQFHNDNDVWFRRRMALCRGHLGEKKQAIEELEKLLLRKKDWFIQWEIATFYFDLRQFTEAMRYAVDAALNYGEPEKKVELFLLLGKILQAIGKKEESKNHIVLSYELRSENKWKIPQELQNKIAELQINTNHIPHSKQLFLDLRKYWQSIKKADSSRFRGRVKTVLQNNIAGFIKGENNREYYFQFRDFHIKKSDIKPGLNVEFSVEKSYDKKREQESERAVYINILKG